MGRTACKEPECLYNGALYVYLWYFSIFRKKKTAQKIQVSMKSETNNRYFTRSPINFFLSYLAEFFLEWEMFETKVVEKIKTRVFCSVPFSPSENRALCDIKWKNVVKRDRLQMAIWRMRIACWIPNATDTQLEYVTIIAFPLQQWLHERAWMLCYTYVHSLHCYELYPYLVLLLL